MTEQHEPAPDGSADKAQAIETFYDEYFAVMDLPAEFFLQTVRLIFQEHALPLGTLPTLLVLAVVWAFVLPICHRLFTRFAG